MQIPLSSLNVAGPNNLVGSVGMRNQSYLLSILSYEGKAVQIKFKLGNF